MHNGEKQAESGTTKENLGPKKRKKKRWRPIEGTSKKGGGTELEG